MVNKASKQRTRAVDKRLVCNSTPISLPFPCISSKADVASHDLLVDQIILLHNILTRTECQAFIKMIDTLPLQLTPQKKRGEAERVNYRFSLQSAAFAENLCALLLPHLPELDTGNGMSRPVSCNSNIRLYKYTPSQFFGAHYDDSVVDPTTGAKSEWTVLVYLSGIEDGVEGGETIFYKSERKKQNETIIAPLTRGTALLHRHGQQCLLHEGSRVRKGIKYVLRSDLMFST
ncbi:hypothetical protein E1B28_008726 [Marasmius oreades]|uniref:Prolyl 4-hydroxylase alpha subunit domain-containing protein n=1 Tax=Marasmius oreades TaxID=181124 RepID=A0A9P7RZ44_9AGAR|nr:uncharacterized protein E1B28_008726 [Marasmius oreades]KAG7092367.1 hypothetical protein E1B28_008726 [Marasmius oreades]